MPQKFATAGLLPALFHPLFFQRSHCHSPHRHCGDHCGSFCLHISRVKIQDRNVSLGFRLLIRAMIEYREAVQIRLHSMDHPRMLTWTIWTRDQNLAALYVHEPLQHCRYRLCIRSVGRQSEGDLCDHTIGGANDPLRQRKHIAAETSCS